MSKANYKVIDGVTRKVKKRYLTIDGVTHKVKKKYVVVDGYTRLFYSAERKLSKKGTATVLSVARFAPAAASTKNHAIFAGGSVYSLNHTDTVDAYDSLLTHSTPAVLSSIRGKAAGASIGGYALVAGGEAAYTSYLSSVFAYDGSLTRTSPTGLSASRGEFVGVTSNNRAIFAGGAIVSSNGNRSNRSTVDAYDPSLTRTTLTALSMARYNLAAAATDKHTFFGGGMTNYNAFQKVVDVYDEVFTRTTLNLSVQRGMLGGAAVGNKALFAGGHYYPGSNIYNTYSSVDMIDESLTLSTATALAASANRMASISTGDFALFMGGEYTYYNTGLESRTETPRSNVNAYDESLTRTNLTALAVARRSPAVAMIDKYIVAAGGSRESGAGSEDITNYANVDVYQIE